MIVREAGPDDWSAMWSIIRQVIASEETYTWDPGTPEATARSLWTPGPPTRAFVAVDRERVVGTARLAPNQSGPGAHVANASFMVAPDAAGRGVGRALGEHVLEAARAQGYLAMQFNAVVETNEPAVALWRSLGFTVVGTVPEAFRSPTYGLVGLHVMHRRL